jgi:hypothetical protein
LAFPLVNELVEAKQQLQLRRVLAHWDRYELTAIDEVGSFGSNRSLVFARNAHPLLFSRVIQDIAEIRVL